MYKTANTAVPVHPLLSERWSPRGFDGDYQVGEDDMAALLEAARWAPPAGNSQPWRFLVARRDEHAHGQLFAALHPGNQLWAGGCRQRSHPRRSAHQSGRRRTAAVRRADLDATLPTHLAARETAPRTRHPIGDLLLDPVPAYELAAA